MGIVALADAKARLQITTSQEDADLSAFIEAIATPVELHLKTIIDPRTIEEDLDLCGRPRFWLTNTPVISLTSAVSLDGSVTYDVTRWKVAPSGLVRVVSGGAPTGTVTLTYRAGLAVIPGNIREGALVILQHVWETQRRPGGLLSGVVGVEEIRRSLSSFTIPAKAREWLGEPRMLVR